jgi:hypothetical protein
LLSSLKREDSIIDAKPTAVTWHTKRSASNENMIGPEQEKPEQEKSMAKQINAIAIVLSSSHVAMLSHPKEVAKVIERAAAANRWIDSWDALQPPS